LVGPGLVDADTRGRELALCLSHARVRAKIADPLMWAADQPMAAAENSWRPPSWVLDSGAYSEPSRYGRWRIDALQYAIEVSSCVDMLGAGNSPDWVSPQDWMTEPDVRAVTGLSIREHLQRTVANLLDLERWWPGLNAAPSPFIPVVQGHSLSDYLLCCRMYADHGVDLHRYPVVGVGSVCRGQATSEIRDIFTALADQGLRCHDFGVKIEGLRRYGHLLASADSLAWSKNARHSPPLPGHRHQHCTSCLPYALRWWNEVMDRLDVPAPPEQLPLWSAA